MLQVVVASLQQASGVNVNVYGVALQYNYAAVA
jgi:hypothetical protein